MIALKVMNVNEMTMGIERGEEPILVYNQEYREGDRILLEVDQSPIYLMIQLDDAIGEHLVYVKNNIMPFSVPLGDKKICYSPKSFSGDIHILKARKASEEEAGRYRNLALNPYDCHEAVNCYPHGSANVETRGELIFAAKNAMNGNHANRSHGPWPYESWGINQNPDAAMKIDFGRKVTVDKVGIYIRADFPHDSYWTQGKLQCSDGSFVEFKLKKTEKLQEIIFEKKEIEWIQLEQLIKANDKSPFPALSQIEVYGY